MAAFRMHTFENIASDLHASYFSIIIDQSDLVLHPKDCTTTAMLSCLKKHALVLIAAVNLISLSKFLKVKYIANTHLCCDKF